jgi:KaiC/GvpD/RAD55 family RecA-like ATPase
MMETSSVIEEAACTSPDVVVEPLLALLRILWRHCIHGPSAEEPDPHSPIELAAALTKTCKGTDPELCEAVAVAWRRQEPSATFSFASVANALLPDTFCRRDLKYFAMRCIRQRHSVVLCSSTARGLHALARGVGKLAETLSLRSISFVSELEPCLTAAAAGSASGPRLARAYLETCQALDLIKPEGSGRVTLRQECTDPGFFLNHLFGLPTAIEGFDDLFSGGGLILADDIAGGRDERDTSIGGRAVVCIGPFGSGKSLLSLQFAREVARKGGVALVVALEQTEEECLYSLESLGIRMEHPTFRVARGELTESYVALSAVSPKRGAIVFLRPEQENQDYSEFLGSVKDRLSWMANYPLRLLVIDPVNAFLHPEDRRPHMRKLTREVFEAAKRANVNVWLNSEELSPKASRNRFEENIADTVIHLGWKRTFGQQRRSIQITKSRFQPEQVGRHGLSIESNGGIRIYPSSAILAARARGGNDASERPEIRLGVPGIDILLGAHHLYSGDIVALAGPGKGKTLLGLQYLLGQSDEEARGGGSLIISDFNVNRLERLVRTVRFARMRDRAQDVELCAVPTGFVEPGQILELIEKALERGRTRFGHLRRVLLTNLGRWEQEMPFLNADATFAMALVQLLRNSEAASFVICGDSLVRGVRLLDTISDQADFLLEFDRSKRQGRLITFVTALKTRQMQHTREEFELDVTSQSIEVKPAPLFRRTGSGELKPVPISLFLHAETENHQEHNQRLLEGLLATISPTTAIHAQNRRFDPALLPMSEFSAIDELQIVQIDEFQMPTAHASLAPASILFSFDAQSNASLLEGRFPEFCAMAQLPGPSRLIAVPFYANVSFFALQKTKVESAWNELDVSAWPDSWATLAELCEKWEALHPARKPEEETFFACPVYERSVETYNCLFFEILQTLRSAGSAEKDDLSLWLDTPHAMQALQIFRTLCRRAHVQSRMLRKAAPKHLGPRALITRHWYNTLNQELSEESDERVDVEVRPLFGNISTAGEWYLAIPAHSASPDIGLRLIEFLTTSDRETDRVELGVGLPTRTKYYDSERASVSRYFSFSRAEVYRLLRNALRRSEFRLYQRVSRTLSLHLEWALDIPTASNDGSGPAEMKRLELEMKRLQESLVQNLRFVLRGGDESR